MRLIFYTVIMVCVFNEPLKFYYYCEINARILKELKDLKKNSASELVRKTYLLKALHLPVI